MLWTRVFSRTAATKWDNEPPKNLSYKLTIVSLYDRFFLLLVDYEEVASFSYVRLRGVSDHKGTVFDADLNRDARFGLTADDLAGDRGLDFTLNETLERTRTVDRVKALLGNDAAGQRIGGPRHDHRLPLR